MRYENVAVERAAKLARKTAPQIPEAWSDYLAILEEELIHGLTTLAGTTEAVSS